MTKEEALQLEVNDRVVYIPEYGKPEVGFVTSIRKGSDSLSIFVCYDGTGRGQLTPYIYLERD